MLWLLGEADSGSDSSAPFAEQLCQVGCEGADVAAIHWTQRADGLTCADVSGCVSMYETVMTGGAHHMPVSSYTGTATASLTSLCMPCRRSLRSQMGIRDGLLAQNAPTRFLGRTFSI